MFQICLMMPLPSEDHSCYGGIVFDGCQYYLIPKGKKNIVKTDSCFKNMEVIPTRRIYNNVCYDSKEMCFWATSKESANELYKLSPSFQEIGRIKLAPFSGITTGLSYCCGDDSILISTKNKICRVTKSCPPNTKEVWNCSGEVIAGVISLSPCFLYFYFLKDLQRIRIVTEDGSILEEIVPAKEKLTPPNDFIIEDVIYNGLQDHCCYFQILATEHGNQQYLLEAKIEKHILGELDPCNHVLFEQIPMSTPESASQESEPNNLLCQECELTAVAQANCRQSCMSCTNQKQPCFSCNNQSILCKTCKECRNPCCCECDTPPSSCTPCKPCKPCKPCRPCSSCCNDVLESIALVETSIAHILNAEGEKLQKVLASTSCICEILEVNKEINKTIVNVTHLEHTLFDKLSMLCECYKQTSLNWDEHKPECKNCN